jgi:hypothetical protein
MSRRRRPPWPLPKLLKMNRNAVTIYISLRWLAGDRRQLNTTRAGIKAVCSLGVKTISAAMQALSDARWIRLNYGRYENKSWYRITFPCDTFFSLQGAPRRRNPSRAKKTPQGPPREGRKTPHRGVRPCRAKNDLHTLKGIGASLQPPPLTADAGGGSGPPAPDTGTYTGQENNAEHGEGRLIVDIVREVKGDG